MHGRGMLPKREPENQLGKINLGSLPHTHSRGAAAALEAAPPSTTPQPRRPLKKRGFEAPAAVAQSSPTIQKFAVVAPQSFPVPVPDDMSTGMTTAATTIATAVSTAAEVHIPLTIPVAQYRDPTPPAATQSAFPNTSWPVPKAALHTLYAAAARKRPISAANFYCWHDNGPAHDRHWTAAFCCPITGEFYLTRPYADQPIGTFRQTPDGLVWCKKKSVAEHGAAALALDCCAYRDLWARTGHTQETATPRPVVLAHGETPYPVEQAVTDVNALLPEAYRATVGAELEKVRQKVCMDSNQGAMPHNSQTATAATDMAWEAEAEAEV